MQRFRKILSEASLLVQSSLRLGATMKREKRLLMV